VDSGEKMVAYLYGREYAEAPLRAAAYRWCGLMAHRANSWLEGASPTSVPSCTHCKVPATPKHPHPHPTQPSLVRHGLTLDWHCPAIVLCITGHLGCNDVAAFIPLETFLTYQQRGSFSIFKPLR
jgi:hypothetical protein